MIWFVKEGAYFANISPFIPPSYPPLPLLRFLSCACLITTTVFSSVLEKEDTAIDCRSALEKRRHRMASPEELEPLQVQSMSNEYRGVSAVRIYGYPPFGHEGPCQTR